MKYIIANLKNTLNKDNINDYLDNKFFITSHKLKNRLLKEGIKEYPKGNGWEVIREEDYIKSKKDEIDPRLAKLREFKIEE